MSDTYYCVLHNMDHIRTNISIYENEDIWLCEYLNREIPIFKEYVFENSYISDEETDTDDITSEMEDSPQDGR